MAPAFQVYGHNGDETGGGGYGPYAKARDTLGVRKVQGVCRSADFPCVEPHRVRGAQLHLCIVESGGVRPWLTSGRGRRLLFTDLVTHLEGPALGLACRRALDAHLDAKPLAALDGRWHVPHHDSRVVR